MGLRPGQKHIINGVIADFGGETLRTHSGDPVELRPQAFAVLRHLAEHAGQVITKNELMRAVWPGIAVTDDSLVQCIHEIRRALRDDERALLKTVPKRGYRLVLPALAGSDTPEHQRRVDPGDLANGHGDASPGSAPAPGAGGPRVSIAVLPFVNMSSDPEQEYFSDGITEDITTDLSRWQSFAVASRNSASRFKGQIVDIRAAGRELGADFLVEGSVRRVGESVRITAQLIDARTGYHVWAERFDRPIADLFAVQDEVVRTIVGTLVGRVYASTAEHLRRRPPSSPAAYDLTMRGNWLAWDEPASRIEAKRCFEQAIALDPGYGLPHSLLALMLVNDWNAGFASSPQALDRAFALAKRGVELADDEGTSHMALSFLYLDRRSFDLALRHMERAVEINPANPATEADLGMLLSHIGRAEEGLERLATARRADPYFGPSWYWPAVGVAEFVLRRYADAMRNFDRGSTRTAARLGIMAGCCARLGLSERARDLVARCLALQPEATIGTLVARMVFKDAGDRAHLAECLRLAGVPE
jgi:TolB-like protein/DNA-binding winged helix-turn-helix (wHTH) protein/tetratricopeptide (TPR) repeat protein